jgi:hypothetical protein
MPVKETLPSQPSHYHHQFSHIECGSTVLITAQCPRALCFCHLTSACCCPFLIISLLPAVRTSASISCFGSRNDFLAPLPRKSASVGFRKVRDPEFFLQKMTMLVKSVRDPSSAFSSSRKIRQEGKADWIVRTMRPVDGRARSPA